MIKAILFDLDGTLINSLDDLADSSNYALKQLNYPTHPLEAYKYFVGDGVLKLMERILPVDKVSNDEIEKIRKIQIEHYSKNCYNKTKPYDGILEMLEELKNRGLKLAVVSNKPDEQAKIVVSRLFRSDLFDVVTGKKDGYKTKPDPLCTIEVIGELGVNNDECIFVGDSGMDMMTAVNAKVLPIGVTWGYRKEDELLENGAKKIICSPKEILQILM